MASKRIFVCNNCGNESSKWLGLCPDCQSWNSFQEMILPESPKKGFKITQSITVPSDIKKIGQIKSTSSERISTTIEEFDRVLGGPSAGSGFPQGIVPGEVILLSGDPGIGKSTIMLQIALNITGKGKRVLYVSGEESESQIKIRAERIVDQKTLLKQDLLVFSSTDIDQAVDIATE